MQGEKMRFVEDRLAEPAHAGICRLICKQCGLELRASDSKVGSVKKV